MRIPEANESIPELVEEDVEIDDDFAVGGDVDEAEFVFGGGAWRRHLKCADV
jgi:hypothetical protein